MRISDWSSDVCSSDLYYLQSRRGNRLFELALGPVALALCGTSDSDTQKLIDETFAEHGGHDFVAAFLAARGLPWEAAVMAEFPGAPVPGPEFPTPGQYPTSGVEGKIEPGRVNLGGRSV